MKQLLLILILLGGSMSISAELQQPFDKGEQNPYGKFFTGQTYLNMLVTNDNIFNSSIANVTFEKVQELIGTHIQEDKFCL